MIGLLAMTAAMASYMDGNHLHDICREDRAQCVLYVDGVSDTIEMMQAMGAAKNSFCTGEGVTAGQAADVVAKYLTDNPATRNESAALLIYIALTDAFPCAK